MGSADPQNDLRPGRQPGSAPGKVAVAAEGGRVAGILPASRFWSTSILVAFALTALVSLAHGVKGALVGDGPHVAGVDFQWSGAHLLAQGQDPWMAYLNGNLNHQIILAQHPNYLAEFYVLLYPLGTMDFSRALVCWCIVNLILLCCTLFMVSRIFVLDRIHSVLLALLTFSCTPFRAALMNGQATFFILFMLTLFYFWQSRLARGTALGLSYAKYSFSPVMFLVQLFKGSFATVLVSFATPILGLAIVKFVLGGSWTTLALEPFRTSRIAMGPGTGDVMTLLESLLRKAGASSGTIYLIPVIAGLAAGIAAAFFIARIKHLKPGAEFALVIAFTLLCFKHVIYDYTVLLAPLAALFAMPSSRWRAAALWIMAYLWFGSGILNQLHVAKSLWMDGWSFAVVLAFAVCLAKSIDPSHAERAAA